MHRKSSVAAVEMPVRDQPVSAANGCRKTASESIAPMATQVISMPAPTTTHPYDCLMLLPARRRPAPLSLFGMPWLGDATGILDGRPGAQPCQGHIRGHPKGDAAPWECFGVGGSRQRDPSDRGPLGPPPRPSTQLCMHKAGKGTQERR